MPPEPYKLRDFLWPILVTTIAVAYISVLLNGCASSDPEYRFKLTEQGAIMKLCSPPELVLMDDLMYKEHAEEVRRALMYWNTAIGKTMFYEVGPASIPPDERGALVYLYIMSAKDIQENGAGTCGLTRYSADKRSGCTSHISILLNPRCAHESYNVENIMRHEFGHVLGLKDVSSLGDLMNGEIPHTGEVLDAQEWEIEAVKRVYGDR